MLGNCIAVGLGGMVGAIARYLISLIPILNRGNFPWATFLVNVAGAFVLSFFLSLSEGYPLFGGRNGLFLRVGLCGGFTTFSTFSAEVFSFFETGRWWEGIFYSLASVMACLFGIWLGRSAARIFAS